ncbi:probable serine/threonine-protein kinase PkwA [Anolis carolinensis]|uniref:probable serine/threonine-protein kinase PkwA n=1 Tax=Anolis carolinensis TaxID=28377 RepID=UPI0004629594|nr:PREDICTED: protein Mut11 [Anolis carolinensis]|eukprot:XP_008122292.1 PREDICTED: protein Mut11 [Anolis carolinensis]
MARRRLEEALQASRLEEEAAEAGRDVAPRRVPLAHDPHGIFSLGFGPAGRQLAVGFGDGALQLVDTEIGLPESSSSLQTGPLAGPVTAVCFLKAQPGLLLAAGAEGSVTAFLPPARSPVASLAEEGNETHALDVCRDGSTFATAGKDRHLRLYDTRTLQLFRIIKAPDFMAGDEFTPLSGHSRRVFALRFHPEELHLFLTGGWDNSVKVWDKRVAKGAQSVINGPHICGPGIDIKGDLVLTASWIPHNALQLWDLRTACLWQDLPFPGSPTQGEFLYGARFCARDMVVAGGSGTSGASVIHTGTGKVAGEILLPSKPVHVVASAPGGTTLAVAGAGGNLHLAQLH